MCIREINALATSPQIRAGFGWVCARALVTQRGEPPVSARVPSSLFFVFYIMAPPTIDADGRFRRALWSGTHPSRGLRSGPLGVVEADDAIWRARILWSLALLQAGGRTAVRARPL